jgi:protein KTI12
VLILSDQQFYTEENERAIRAELKNQFDRQSSVATVDTLIIVDSMNSIKGFRYELYCISKATRQTHGVIWVLNTVQNCIQNNKECQHYSDTLLEELIQRYEPPDERNRWDQPLFRVDVRSDEERQEEELLESQVLQQSIYDMHNLKDTLDQTAKQDNNAEGAADNVTFNEAAVDTKPVKKKGTSFKRAAAKRPVAPKPGETQDELPESSFPISFINPFLDEPTAEPGLDKSDAHSFVRHHPRPHPDSQRYKEDPSLPLDERIDQLLESFLTNTKRLKEGTSTQQHAASESNVLHLLDTTTQQVLSCIVSQLELRKNDTNTDHKNELFQIQLSNNNVPPQLLHMNASSLSISQLRQLREQFLNWMSKYPPDRATSQSIATSFIEYIQQNHADK